MQLTLMFCHCFQLLAPDLLKCVQIPDRAFSAIPYRYEITLFGTEQRHSVGQSSRSGGNRIQSSHYVLKRILESFQEGRSFFATAAFSQAQIVGTFEIERLGV